MSRNCPEGVKRAQKSLEKENSRSVDWKSCVGSGGNYEINKISAPFSGRGMKESIRKYYP